MNFANLLSILLVGASAAAIVKKLTENGGPAPSPAADSPVVGAIQEALQQHKGEDRPMVHAFESLLEQETQQEERLADTLGVHA